ncbi:MAG TPA: glycosyltransferase family protein, partial [Candidatus Limnocylindrales bacterium]|nr:glycosyltransferase family protein [Candidatus Limnocylindrales bacterium]
MRTVAIVQARTGSTRLPGKVLARIGGRPMLAHVVERARAAPGVDEVVVATSVLPEDDAIAGLCAESGWPCERGSATDLLDRYERAAAAHDAEVVVRVTGDCPLLDPALVGEVIALLGRGGYDYASNTLEPRTWPHGLDAEAFTRAALATAWAEDTDPAWREHVTPFLYRHPERFRLGR